MAWLGRRLELGPERTVLDVGAGTGKLTRALAPARGRLIALEPVSEMRAVLERQLPEAQVVDGRAESIPLPPSSVDAVVSGQAFHWFDGPRALEEFHRVLRPEGGLGLIWNRRDGSQPQHRAIDEIIGPYREGVPAHATHRWAQAFDASSRFALAEEAVFPFEQPVETDGFLDRVMSISFIAALDEPERRSVEERLRGLAAGGLEALRYNTEVFVYRRLPD